MNKFSFTKAGSVDAAVDVLAQNIAARPIAGGTNLIDLMKEGVMNPNALVDINGLTIDGIVETEDGGLRLGAIATNANTAYHPQVEEKYPLLSMAILAGASPQLRNMATNGGNLMQRTRCYYFYDLATPCNKRAPGSGCSAMKGYNRIHAILGWSDQCIAVHPSDMCVALAALDAVVEVSGKSGKRQIPFASFHRLPGDAPEIDNTLQQDELITGIILPPSNFAKNYAYLKIRDRLSYAFALVSVAAAMELAGNVIKDARLAMGGVAHKPWRMKEAEESLKGKEATAENFAAAADILLSGAEGFAHNSFKIELAKRAIVRALSDALNPHKNEDDQHQLYRQAAQ